MDLFNRCVGLGDSFNVNITAVPVPRKGAIAFAGHAGHYRQGFLLHPARPRPP